MFGSEIQFSVFCMHVRAHIHPHQFRIFPWWSECSCSSTKVEGTLLVFLHSGVFIFHLSYFIFYFIYKIFLHFFHFLFFYIFNGYKFIFLHIFYLIILSTLFSFTISALLFLFCIVIPSPFLLYFSPLFFFFFFCFLSTLVFFHSFYSQFFLISYFEPMIGQKCFLFLVLTLTFPFIFFLQQTILYFLSLHILPPMSPLPLLCHHPLPRHFFSQILFYFITLSPLACFLLSVFLWETSLIRSHHDVHHSTLLPSLPIFFDIHIVSVFCLSTWYFFLATACFSSCWMAPPNLYRMAILMWSLASNLLLLSVLEKMFLHCSKPFSDLYSVMYFFYSGLIIVLASLMSSHSLPSFYKVVNSSVHQRCLPSF